VCPIVFNIMPQPGVTKFI